MTALATPTIRIFCPDEFDTPKRPLELMSLRQMFTDKIQPEMKNRDTIKEYLTLISEWEELTDNLPITEITKPLLSEFQEQLTQQKWRGEFRKSATINKKFRYMRRLVRLCWPADSHNPGGLGACGYFVFPDQLDEDNDELPYIFTNSELNRLYAACEKQTWPKRQAALTWRTILVTHFCTGPRTFDLMSLKRRNVDFEFKEVGSITYRARKTKKLQRVPLHASAHAHLKQLCRKLEGEQLFPGFERTNKTTIRRHWRKLREQAGITAHAVMEDMRKTCNTAYNDRWPGVGDFILGHRLSGVNARHYYNPSRKVFRAVQKLRVPESFLSLE